MRIDLNCPAETAGAELIRQEDSWVRLILLNLSDRAIDSCEATVRVLDRDGNEAGRTVHRARSLKGRPHSAFSMMIPMELPEEAVSAEAVLDKVWFEDHDVWRREKSRETEYESNLLPPGNELNALKYAAGKDAVGFPSQQAEVWVCVCGRPNSNREQLCARCRRQRDMIFQQYNRNAALRRVSQRERQLDLQTRGALEENNQLQRIREEEYNRQQARRARRRHLAAALAAALCLAAVCRGLGLPALRLWSADIALREERLEDAKEILTSLGSFPGAAARLDDAELGIMRRDGALSAENPAAFPPDQMEEMEDFLRSRGDGAADAALADRVTLSRARALLDLGGIQAAQDALKKLPEDLDGREQLWLESEYARGEKAMQARNYPLAREIFEGLGDYPGAGDKVREAIYEPALASMENGDYDEAVKAFAQIEDYQDSAELIRRCQYLKGFVLESRGETAAAREAYLAAGDYEDAAERARTIRWNEAEGYLAAEDYASALPLYREMDGYEDARTKWIQCATELARVSYRQREYIQAAAWLEDLPEDTRDTLRIRTRAYYLGAKAAAGRGELEEAIFLMEKVPDYSDAPRNIRTWRIELASQKMDQGELEEAREILQPVAENYNAQRLLKEIEEKLTPAEEATENP